MATTITVAKELREIMEKGKISVIIPVYNAERYVRETISDVIAQTYQNLEIVLVDDSSTDNSLAILQEYVAKDSRIKVISSSKNAGASHARNLGLEVASGEFIRFVDADDRLPKDSLEKLLHPYQQDDTVDLVIGNYTCTPKINVMTGDTINEGKIDRKELINLFITYVRSFYFGVPWNKLYRREIIEENHLRFDESVFWCEDFLFNIGYYKKCEQFYILKTDNGIYEYCKREESITENLRDDSRIDLEQIDRLRFEVMRDYCKLEGLEDRFELEWKYSDLFWKLSATTEKRKVKIKLVQRYENFKNLLKEDDVYKYICQKEKETHLKVWKLLKYSKANEKYFFSFCFFCIKAIITEYGKVFLPFLRTFFQEKIPKHF